MLLCSLLTTIQPKSNTLELIEMLQLSVTKARRVQCLVFHSAIYLDDHLLLVKVGPAIQTGLKKSVICHTCRIILFVCAWAAAAPTLAIRSFASCVHVFFWAKCHVFGYMDMDGWSTCDATSNFPETTLNLYGTRPAVLISSLCRRWNTEHPTIETFASYCV